jgi:hypothetical protein
MAIWIAPGIELDQYDESRRLEAYQKRTTDWILAHAIDLSKRQDGGLPAMIVACSVIEPVGGIITGSGATLTRFTAGFDYIFPKLGIGKEVYERLRGGLYHEGFIKEGLLITSLKEAIEVQDGHICIDPVHFATAVNNGFQRFCGDIQNDVNGLRERFDAYWEKKTTVNSRGLQNTRPLAAPHITGGTSAATPMPYGPRYFKKM